MDKVIENWDKILQTVKADYDVGDVAFNTWLKPLKVYDVKDNVITKTLLVPSEQVRRANPKYIFDTFVVGSNNKWLMRHPWQLQNLRPKSTTLCLSMEAWDLARLT